MPKFKVEDVVVYIGMIFTIDEVGTGSIQSYILKDSSILYFSQLECNLRLATPLEIALK